MLENRFIKYKRSKKIVIKRSAKSEESMSRHQKAIIKNIWLLYKVLKVY